MSTRTHVALVPFALCCLCGCAAFRAGQLGEINGWPPKAPAARRPVNVLFSGEATFNGTERNLEPTVLRIWSKRALRAYRDSGLFSEVKTGLEETDLRAEVRVVRDERGSLLLAWLTWQTAFAVPYRSKRVYTVYTVLKDRKGTTLGHYECSESVVVWAHLVLIPVMPFRLPGRVSGAILRDLHRSTLLQAREEGAL